jgi:hypothetical protein
MELLCNGVTKKFLIILAHSMKVLQCMEKNNIDIELTIVTSIIEYDIIVYQYILKAITVVVKHLIYTEKM